ncbi:MAG: GNAT family N-acetyltransferase [Acidimicrobiales bacterium]
MIAHAIREIGLSDRAVLAAAVDAFGATDDRSDEWVTGFVADRLSFAFVALGADDEMLGWIWGSIIRRPDAPATARIEALDVRSDARRSGIGSMLFDAAYAHARQLLCGDVVADVSPDAGPAVVGFVESLRPVRSARAQVCWSL